VNRRYSNHYYGDRVGHFSSTLLCPVSTLFLSGNSKRLWKILRRMMNCSMNSTTSNEREVRSTWLARGSSAIYSSQEEEQEEEHGSQNCAWMKSKKGTRAGRPGPAYLALPDFSTRCRRDRHRRVLSPNIAKSQKESGPERQVRRKKKDRKWMDAIMKEREDRKKIVERQRYVERNSWIALRGAQIPGHSGKKEPVAGKAETSYILGSSLSRISNYKHCRAATKAISLPNEQRHQDRGEN
jgi:hypothetical protein